MKAGLLIIVSAPSGGGKTSLVHAVREADPRLRVAVSHTTRPKRPGEQDGVNYHFVSPADFKQLQADGAFLESANVFGNHYGTSHAAVQAAMQDSHDVVLEIDWQGAQQVQANGGDELVSVFILPPSRAALIQRLQGRGQDNDHVIAKRMADAISEMSHYDEYDFVIINDDFDQAVSDMQAILRAERLRRQRQQIRQGPLLKQLLLD